MKTVYVVLLCSQHGTQVMAVFSSLEAAKVYVNESPIGLGQYYIEESPWNNVAVEQQPA